MVVAVAGVWLSQKDASPVLCELLQAQLSKQTGGEVRFGGCSVHLLQRKASLRGLVIDTGEGGFFLEVEALDIKIGGLRWRGLELQEVVIQKPTVHLRMGEVPFSAVVEPRGCWLEYLKHWVVQKVEVVEGGVELEFPGAKAQLKGFSLQWSQKGGQGWFRTGIEDGQFQFQGGQEEIGRMRLEAELDVGEERLRLRSGEFSLGQMIWRSSGEVEDLCAAQPYIGVVSQVYVPANMLGRWLGFSEAEGHFRARISLNGRSRQLTARAELDAVGLVLEGMQPGDFRAKLAYAGKTLLVEELRIPIGEGGAQLQGEMEMEGSWPLRFTVATQNVSLAQILERVTVPGSWVDFEASLKGKFVGQIFPKLGIWGDVEASTGPFILASRSFRAPKEEGVNILQFQQSRMKFRFGILEDRVEFRNIHVEAGQRWLSQAEGVVILFFKEGGGISVEAEATKLQLLDFGHIAQIPWMGSGSGRVSVLGQFREGVEVQGAARFNDFVFGNYALGTVHSSIFAKEGVLSFPGIVGQKRRTAFFGRVDLHFEGGAPKLVAFAQIPSGHVEDVLEVLLPLHPAFETLQGKLRGKASGSLAFSSPAETFTGAIQLDVEEVELMQLPLGKGAIELSLAAGKTLRISPTLLTSEFGRLRAFGSWDFDGSMDFSADYETQVFGKWLGAVFPQALSGPLTLKARVLGDATVPDVRFVIRSAQLFWQDRSLGPVRVEGRVLGRELTLLGSPVAGVHFSAGMMLKEPYAYHLSAAIEQAGISFGLPMLVSTKARLKARGELNNPKVLTADADIELLRFSREGFSVSNKAPAQLSYADERFKLSFLQMQGPNTTLLAQGILGLRDSNFSIYGTVDLRLLETLLPGIEDGAGEVGITAVVGGGLRNPSIAGVAELHQAQATLKAWPLSLERVNAQIEFSNQRVWIHDVQAQANGGQVQAQGALSWNSSGLGDIALGGQFQKVNLEVLPGVPGVFSGNLQLEGSQHSLTLAGQIEAEKLRYETPLALEDLLLQVGNRSHEDTKPAEEWLKYDIMLKAGDVHIDNNLARVRLLGQARLLGSNVQPDLYGTIETAPGGEAYFRGNTFGIQRGLLQFSGKTNSLQFAAQSQIQEYLIFVKASGDLSHPKVVLSSEPSLTEADILSVLTIGTTSDEQLASASAGVSLAAQFFFSVSGLERRFQNLFSGSSLLLSPQMQFATTVNEITGLTEPSVRLESKLLSERFRIGVVQPLFTGRGTKAQLEWRINDRVSLRAQWDNWNQANNPGFDLKFRFEWE